MGTDSGSSSSGPPVDSTPEPEPCEVVCLDAFRRQHLDGNVGTMILGALPFGTVPNIRETFLRCYPSIRRLCQRDEGPGVALIALDTRFSQVAGEAWLPTQVGVLRPAIVGRHERAHMALSGPSTLSLRHLLILASATTDAEGLRPWVRVMDLRSSVGFEDEDGQRRDGLLAEGPMFLRCAGHVLCLLPTSQQTQWPASASDAWDALPPRIYTDAPATGYAPKLPPRPRAVDGDAPISCATFIQGPRDFQEKLLEPGEEPLGQLTVRYCDRATRLTVGAQALGRGILLGRCSRCDGSSLLNDSSFSRVHVMVLRVDNRVIAIDTASTNGTGIPIDDGVSLNIDLVCLDAHPQLVLANAIGTLEWEPR